MTGNARTGTPSSLDLSGLPENIARAVRAFFEPVVRDAGPNLLSAAIVGSALTADYRPGVSDINSCLVLERVEVDFLDRLADLGRRHSRKGLAVPLLMTGEYIRRSLDTFPLEFLGFQISHAVIFGTDYFAGLAFDKPHVRLACERELKALSVNLQRNYLSCLGSAKALRNLLLSSMNATIPVLRGLLYLQGLPSPLTKAEVVRSAEKALALPAAPFDCVLHLRESRAKRPFNELRDVFRGFYEAIDAQSRRTDSL